MLRKSSLLILTVAISIAFPAFGQFTGDGFKNVVVGSKHDLSANANVTGATAVCEFCHAPHKIPGMGNGTPNGAQPPLLWNIQVKSGPYATYGGSSTLNATDLRDPSTASSTKQAAYMSLLCLSCHDGAITAASFYYTDVIGTVGSITPPTIGESGGNGLSNDHPVDFTYSAALATADGGLQTPTEGAGVRIPYVGKNKPLPLFKDQIADTSGRLECATCHNPHDNSLNGGSYFLRMDNTKSAICLNCHGN